MVQTTTSDTDDSISKKTLLKQQLRQKYKKHCESFLPVPFLQNSVYKIYQLFVDGGIEDMSVRSEANAVLPKPLSYRDILKLCGGKEQIIVEGDPGYGKTMLSFRLAYDWCCEVDGDIDIFILLKMRNLGGINSLPSAIKKFLLPHDSVLSEGDIDSILKGAPSFVVVLDSFDKYPDASNYGSTFVKLIMTKQILANSTVILTTRPSSLPPAVPVTSKRIRLSGFTKDSQNKYIQNVITERKLLEKTVDELFQKNAILEAICQVPLFFTLLVHITFEGSQNDQHDYPSMTSFFHDVVKYFHCYINEELENIPQHREFVFEKQHFKLEKMAFEGLSKNHQKIFWSRDKCRHNLGDEFYNHCLNVGLFFEEDIKDRESVPSPEDSYKFTSLVRFYHNIFCEWYAACHLARLAEKLSSNEFKTKLKSIDPTNLQYVYRFACGLNKVAAEKIIGYLESFKDGQKFAILCILEQQKMSHRIMDTVENLCKSPVIISLHDGRLFHITALEFLKIASARKISVKEVWLTNMEGSVKDSKKIVFKSGLELESIDTLLQLSIFDVGRQFSGDDILGFLKYATMCSQLSVLRFRACILPRHMELCSLPGHFVERKITVEWNPLKGNVWFKLNLISGNWEHQRKELKKEQYSQIVEHVGSMLKRRRQLSAGLGIQNSPTISKELADFLGMKPTDSREDIKEMLRKHCLSPINIHNIQDVKVQRTFVELLTFASECKIHIECVWLVGLYSTFENSGLKFCSGVILPKLHTLRQLSLIDTGRTFSDKDLLGILQYSCVYPTISNLRLRDCLLPEKINLEEIGVDREDKDISGQKIF
ncbi:Protein NLRC5 [Holothuria leucospilota]|uniref:Protein NLRC5 n=1 Tax=Holothuria leucospilota TaxID=206669 RepID=A0A9Q1HKI4_HOLLE|nr:Protein NLRC5 [Holothuria leucospilota]